MPAVAIASFTVWLLRDFAIWLLFSAKFTAMRDLFAWQLVGDVLKVGAYVFGYLVIAKASLRLYILAEIGQFALLTAFSHWLIPTHGALGRLRPIWQLISFISLPVAAYFYFGVNAHDCTDTHTGIGYPASQPDRSTFLQ